MDILKYFLLGSGYAFAAVVQPGPLQAFLLSRVAVAGWKRTLPACLSPLISDGPIAIVALVLIGQVPSVVQEILRMTGGLLLIYFAWRAFAVWRRPGPMLEQTGSAPRTLLQATIVNLLNPNPYLGWALVLGPSAESAWQEHWTNAAILIVSFYGTMVLGLAGFIIMIGTAHFLGSRAQRVLQGFSVIVLAALGIYLLASSGFRLLLR